MKQTLFYFALLLAANALTAQQIKFCHPGAFWNYSFVNIPAWGGIYSYSNEQIVYTGDSIALGDTIKFLSHKKYYSTCYNSQQTLIKRTLIKQKGDTIFFRNAITNNSWQILINFATPVGGSWQTTYNKANGSPATFSFTVDSIKQVLENGYSLKRLYTQLGMFTERFGCHNFMFPYYSFAGGCDGLWFADFLCYTDQSFGTKQFTDKACSYSGQINVNGLSDHSGEDLWQISPNPGNSVFLISSSAELSYNYQVYSASGELLNSGQALKVLELDLKDSAPGLYYVVLREGSNSLCLKLVKQ
jgi:hypothetical protein